ncbi:hypothetical protein PPERSA_08809 [Pseudocohnilembus persalinus]|uniref:ELMO domain-containing protein n=1 Tax=Pseudocohnilembus persalinus TaxID=266149 RepID=A0A0V0R4D4_PSEPJ|nr:hypothetical protein PPERSA_08809 [Pseudocohnilembus persalinus]|eukprot:KRX09093.1 hypothetical protein PPERSA_08809 [Pseudocohnilembus persalinus]
MDFDNKVDSKQSLIVLNQPQTHLQNKGYIESILGLVIPNFNYDLTKNEIQAFKELQDEINDPEQNKILYFDQKNTNHNKFLTSLYYELTNSTIKEEDIDQEFWIQYGFQQKNPRTDFRGSGVLGAKQLLDFVQKHKDIVKDMINPENNFFMAISSISVTSFLIKYFHLPKNLNYQENHQELCGRKEFKNFCRMLKRNPYLLYDLHQLFLTHLFENHKKLMRQNTQAQFLLISDKQRFQATQSQFTKALESANYKSLKQFKDAFWGKHNNGKHLKFD